jgi:hypothetical protein
MPEMPAGERRRLLGVVLTARVGSVQSGSFTDPGVTDRICRNHSDRMAWPEPKIPLGVQVAALIAPQHGPRFSADWAAARAKDDARRAANEAW